MENWIDFLTHAVIIAFLAIVFSGLAFLILLILFYLISLIVCVIGLISVSIWFVYTEIADWASSRWSDLVEWLRNE